MPKGVYPHKAHDAEWKRKVGEKLRGRKYPGKGIGHYVSEETKQKISIANTGKKHSEESILKQSGENSINWKGDEVKYRSLHERMYKVIEKPDICCRCGSDRFLVLHNISGNYPVNDLSDWEYICKKCHQNEHKPKNPKPTLGSFKKGHPYYPRKNNKDE